MILKVVVFILILIVMDVIVEHISDTAYNRGFQDGIKEMYVRTLELLENEQKRKKGDFYGSSTERTGDNDHIRKGYETRGSMDERPDHNDKAG